MASNELMTHGQFVKRVTVRVRRWMMVVKTLGSQRWPGRAEVASRDGRVGCVGWVYTVWMEWDGMLV